MGSDLTVDASSQQVIFVVNGPGEISTWLWPITHALKLERPDIRIVACVIPSTLSTGAEVRILKELATIDAAYSTRQTLGLILWGRPPEGFNPCAQSLLFYLGDSPGLSLLMARRLRAKTMAYIDYEIPFASKFQKLFASGLDLRSAEKVGALPVGSLMVDSAALRRANSNRALEGKTYVGLFPGSRDYMVDFLLPYYAVVVDALRAKNDDIRFIMAKSDYVSDTVLASLDKPRSGQDYTAKPLKLHNRDGAQWLETSDGTPIEILSSSVVLATAHVALTIPGSNTAELAASGIPMVVIVPTHFEDSFPVPGPLGFVGRLPIIGRHLRPWMWRQLHARIPLLAQPNRRTGKMIVPELIGKNLQPEIVKHLDRFISSSSTAIGRELRDAMGGGGAAHKLAAEISAALPPKKSLV